MASNNDNHSLNQDPQLRRGSKGFPLLPGGYGRSTYYLGAPTPYAVRGEGYKVWDDRGRELIDANNNFTTLIHGNAHPALVEAASRVIKNGSCWGIPNKQEWEHAELLLARLPGLDQVRYTNSGTEAVMTAVRVARGVTGRDGIIMMQNGYHGSSDLALCTGGPQYRRGVPAGVSNDVTLVAFNDLAALEEAVAARPDYFAAIIIDVLPNRAGLIAATPEFIKGARALASRYGVVLIIDEVISLRLGFNGACTEYGITPDLLTTGKLIGGGFPVGAFAGREELMRHLDPTGPSPLPQAGTFSGNPVSMAAGAESLRLLTSDVIGSMNALGDEARLAIADRVEALGWEVRGKGSLFRPFPKTGIAYTAELQHKLWWAAYDRGVLLSPANLIALSSPMTQAVVNDLADRLTDAIRFVAVN
ncbi:glutamate-1-semialdehyde 2,1-aminomutase [Pseudomonas brassicacearum]|uniref:Glutamate-1-semialdehyde 2,1-aminomutase n=1 Tax=Pseudomonas brassicacearum TaxID=930166 RepID=A0AAW8M8F2_9PSED|nr:aminotransferase class III-fold pyridoxal phosphate-dependent enzyme [Pseudomonas brassicacearum]MDR6958312.1 glutamate-1-semialdehyde 2,1-aminomutase [Pseudomonas brassicacearum]